MSKMEVFILKDIAEIKGGKRLPKGEKLLNEQTSYPYIRVADFLETGTIDTKSIKYVTEEIYNKISRYTISSDNVYISIAGTIGKTGIIPEDLNGANLTENAAKFVFYDDSQIDKYYFYYFSISETFQKQIKEATKVVAIPKLALKRLGEFQIPLPPLREQKRIVQKLDTLFQEIEAAKQLVEENLATLPLLKKSWLQQAFEGQLLGKSAVDEKGLPLGWERKSVKELATVMQSGFACSKKYEDENGYVHLRTHNISTRGILNFDTIIKIDKDKVDAKRAKLYKGDVLFNNTNSQELVGKTVYVDKDYNYGFSNHLTRINFVEEVAPKWVVYYFNFLLFRGYFAAICKRWIGQAGVNSTKLKAIKIPIPPMEDQKALVKKLDQLFQEAHQIEEQQQAQLEELEQLKKSLLEQAFRGAL